MNKDILEILEHVWASGSVPPSLSVDLEKNIQLKKLVEEILNVQHMAMVMANGDLSYTLKVKGVMAGALKSLQSDLRHLTWQTQMISKGDFDQKVDFMGEFSESFNSMVQNLEKARSVLQQREMDLTHVNKKLQDEISERIHAEKALHQVNEQLHVQIKEIQSLHEQLREQAIRDPLTQLFNRRYLQETLERELAFAQRNHSTLAVILLDIDHFKHINDTYGHHAGDLMLKSLSNLLCNNMRKMDLACRYGGEEFVIVMPGAPLDAAYARAEQIRLQFEQLKVTYDSSVFQTTISLGIAGFPCHGLTEIVLLQAADNALYAAKEAGRNCIVSASGELVAKENKTNHHKHIHQKNL